MESSEKGPLEEFANVFRSALEHQNEPRPWRIVQFNPDDSQTRYFDAMVRQIERSLKMSAYIASPMVLGQGSKLGSDLNATTISIENSFNIEGDDYSREVAREARCRRIVDFLTKMCEKEPVCFLFVGAGEFLPQDLRHFRELIWDAGLVDFQSSGVMVVTFSHRALDQSISWPSPDATVCLADNYDEESRQHAVEDLANQLILEGKYTMPEPATAYSTGVLDSHAGPATLYATLAAIASRMKQ
ncbi:hypothetical protein [Comamonas terrigena]|uniref:hypothetical protein n=1 Tax=Comamonas terrigena TaxID=32013 RepID=UPI0024482094|nr:hypothetical protein [Comamonas terrigena]MDH1701853.1 hypothetical protein [Comamonas terrigena]